MSKEYNHEDYTDKNDYHTEKGFIFIAKTLGIKNLQLLKCNESTNNLPIVLDLQGDTDSAPEWDDFTTFLQKKKGLHTVDNLSSPPQEFFAIEHEGHWTLLVITYQPDEKLEYTYINSKTSGEDQESFIQEANELDHTFLYFLKAIQDIYGKENVTRKVTSHDVKEVYNDREATYVCMKVAELQDDNSLHSQQQHILKRSDFPLNLKRQYTNFPKGIQTKIRAGYHSDNHTKADDFVLNYITSSDTHISQELDQAALDKFQKHMNARIIDYKITQMSMHDAIIYNKNPLTAPELHFANQIAEPTAYSGLGIEAKFVEEYGVKGFKVTAVKEGADTKLHDLKGKTITHYTVNGVQHPITREENYVHIRNNALEYGKLSLIVQDEKGVAEEIKDIQCSLFHGEQGKGKFNFVEAVNTANKTDYPPLRFTSHVQNLENSHIFTAGNVGRR